MGKNCVKLKFYHIESKVAFVLSGLYEEMSTPTWVLLNNDYARHFDSKHFWYDCLSNLANGLITRSLRILLRLAMLLIPKVGVMISQSSEDNPSGFVLLNYVTTPISNMSIMCTKPIS